MSLLFLLPRQQGPLANKYPLVSCSRNPLNNFSVIPGELAIPPKDGSA